MYKRGLYIRTTCSKASLRVSADARAAGRDDSEYTGYIRDKIGDRFANVVCGDNASNTK